MVADCDQFIKLLRKQLRLAPVAELTQIAGTACWFSFDWQLHIKYCRIATTCSEVHSLYSHYEKNFDLEIQAGS